MSDPTDITPADITSAMDSISASDATAAASTPEPAASASAGATAQPADTDDLTDQELTGMIPAERVKRSLANREKKVTERLTKEWDEQHGWTKGISREDFDAYRREQAIAGTMSPADYVANLWKRVEADPRHGPQLRSMAARILGQRQAQQPAADAEPEPDIPTDASNGVPVVYSAKQQRLHDQWLTRQILSQVGQQIAPLQETHQSMQQAREQQQAHAAADAVAARSFGPVSKLPGFKEHAAAIMEKYAALGVTTPNGWMPDPNDLRTEGEKLRDVYSEVVIPILSSTVRQQAVSDMTRKAGASTINPNAASTGQPFNHKTASWKESLEYELGKRGLVK